MRGLERFLAESLAIEGIQRRPTREEIAATEAFLRCDLSLDVVCTLQEFYAPMRPLRLQPGMNVRVGAHVAPRGGPEIGDELDRILADVRAGGDPWRTHCRFETLHPFMDGNGRTGRAVWAWSMLAHGADPFALSFLHRWYYQTLARVDRPAPDREPR